MRARLRSGSEIYSSNNKLKLAPDNTSPLWRNQMALLLHNNKTESER